MRRLRCNDSTVDAIYLDCKEFKWSDPGSDLIFLQSILLWDTLGIPQIDFRSLNSSVLVKMLV